MRTVLAFLFCLCLTSFKLFGQCPSSNPITGPTQVCLGSTITYAVPYFFLGSTWTVTGTSTDRNILGSNTPTASVTWAALGTYTITFTFSGIPGCTVTSTLSVAVVSGTAPSIPTITGPSVICSNGQALYSVPQISGLIPAWSVVSNSGILATTPTFTANGNQLSLQSNSAGRFFVFATYSNGTCSGPVGVNNVTSTAGNSPISISSDGSTCLGGTSTYTIYGGDAGNTYAWSLSPANGGTINLSGSGNNQAAITWNSIGTYTVTATSTSVCNTTQQATKSITTNNVLPTPGNIVAPTAVCGSSGFTATVPSVSGATGYFWKYTPPNSQDQTTTGSNSISLSFTSGPGVGTVSVASLNGTCQSPFSTPANINIVVNPQPNLSPYVSGPGSVCVGTTRSFSITNPDPNSSYSWALLDGSNNPIDNSIAQIVNASGSTVQIQFKASGSLTILPTGTNVCGSTIPGPSSGFYVYIDSNTTPSISINGVTSACLGSYSYSAVYAAFGPSPTGPTSTPPPPFTNINFSLDGGGTLSQTYPSFLNAQWTAPGIHVMSISATTGCGYVATANLPVTVINSQKPVVSISGNTSVCVNSPQTYTAIGSGTSFQWSCDGCQYTPTNGSSFNVLWTNSGVYGISVTPSTQQCQGDHVILITSVNAPSLNSTLTPGPSCSGSLFSYNGTSLTTGATLSWTRAAVAGILQPQSAGNCCISEVLTNTTSLPINVTYVYTIAGGGCTNQQNVVVTVNPNPIVNPISNQSVCNGSATAAVNITGTSSSMYVWTNNNNTIGLPANGVGDIPPFNAVNNGITPVTATITVTPYGPNNGVTCTGATTQFSITVKATNTVGAASSSPTLCIGTAISPSITIATTGATGMGTPTGLPAGVTATWAGNIITISGTPTVSGTFGYSIPLTGGCGSVNASGNITVKANNTAGTPSSSPTLCIGTAISPSITIATIGATGMGTPTGLPAGVTATWASNTITISGTPTVSGTFGYSIPLTGGCGAVNATGSITVTANRTAGTPSSSPTLCIGTAISPSITIATTAATGIGTPTGLPAGVTATWASNTITISGTPTVGGTFNYSIPLTGGCGTVNASGTITVNATNTVGTPSSSPTLCIGTAISPSITIATTGATGIGTPNNLPTGVTATWASNTITISGTPTVSGTFGYSIPLTGGCGAVNATGNITVTANRTAGAASSSPTLCIGTAISPSITIATTAATGIGTPTGLPAGVTATWASNTITISGTPTVGGTFNYSIPLTGGCGTANASGNINVSSLPTATITPSGIITLCNGATATLTASAGSSYLWSTGATTQSIVVSTAGKDSVRVTNAAGCSAWSPFVKILATSFTASISAPNGLNICAAGGVSLVAGPSGTGYTYSWSDGETFQTIYPSSVQTFTLTVSKSGCTSTATVKTTRSPSNCQLTRISANPILPSGSEADNDPPTVEELTVYPNPSSSVVTIATPWRADRDLSVVLYDIYGNVVNSTTLKKGEWKAQLNVVSHAQGMYIVRIVTGEVINVTKLIVER